MKNTRTKRKRSARGAGRLYKRDATGKEHPAEWTGAGAYWLAYVLPSMNGEPGRRVREALRDRLGNPIIDRDQAEVERRRILAPYQTGNALETLRALKDRVEGAAERHAEALEDANPPLRVKEGWLAYKRAPERPDSGPLTLNQYEGHWNRFETWIESTHKEVVFLRDVSPGIAAEYAADLTGQKLSGNRFNKHVGFLRLAFRVLADAARIQGNPFDKIRRKNQRPHSRRELTIEELRTILDRASGDMAHLLYLGAATGLRLGDCCTLTWGEVDLDRGIIRRIPNKTAKSGKPVVVGIPPALHERLESIKGRRGYILPVLAEKYWRDPTLITNAIRDHVINCGIDVHSHGTGTRIKRSDDGTPERDPAGMVMTEITGKPAVVEVGFHSLRHTWVSMHAAAGTPGAVIQASVGHSNPSMTAHYTHVNEITARDVARALPAFGDGSPVREPLPPWAVEVIERLDGKNWKTIKGELMSGFPAGGK